MIQILGTVVGGGLAMATYYVYSTGLLSEVHVEESKIPTRKLVYFEHEGVYQDFGPVFKKLINDSVPFLMPKSFVRVTYDDTYSIQDPAKARSVIGLELDNINDENGASLLCKSKSEYKVVQLPETDSVNAKYDIKQKNFSIAFFAISTKVYPAIGAFVAKLIEQKKMEANEANRLVEIFKFDEKKNPYEIEFNAPFGKLGNSYNLHSKPKPAHNQSL